MISFSYDALGRRTSKRVVNVVYEYIYSGNDVIEETQSNVNPTSGVKVKKETREYTYGARGTDDAVAVKYSTYDRIKKVDVLVTTGDYYYEKNHLGSVIRITDSNGNIIDEYSYTVFGKPYRKNTNGVYKPVSGSNKSAINNTRLYTGREYDREISLYYMRARYYDAGLGRFVSRDPIGMRDNVNLYTYVGNSPVMYTDIFGKEKKFVMYFDRYLELDEIVGDMYFFMLSTDTQQTLLAEYADVETKAKYIHYNRNQLNTDLPSSPEEAVNEDWQMLEYWQNIFHQNTATLLFPNTKYVSTDGHKEVIFNYDGGIVTDPRDFGTYNFFDPTTQGGNHATYDVKPYTLWGNIPN